MSLVHEWLESYLPLNVTHKEIDLSLSFSNEIIRLFICDFASEVSHARIFDIFQHFTEFMMYLSYRIRTGFSP